MITLFILIFSGYLGVWGYIALTHTHNATTAEVHISPGTSLRKTTHILHQAGIIHHPWVLEIYLRVWQVDLHPGVRVIPATIPLSRLITHLSRPDKTSHFLTIIEGSTPLHTRLALNNDRRFSGKHISLDAIVPIMGDTYAFTPNEPRHQAYKRWHTMVLMQACYLWQIGTTQDVISTPNELIILASLIEKETALACERRRIAGVFINRLRHGMRLQADCTVVYGLCRENPHRPWNQGLTKAELKTPSPYNTYVHKGLPPGAIANPSLASLKAAASPLATKDLYFVADGKGGHVFSQTQRQHAQRHNSWRRIRAQTGHSKPLTRPVRSPRRPGVFPPKRPAHKSSTPGA